MLTTNQMLSILPISLAQSKAGNDSEKRKTWNKATTLLVALFKKMNLQSIIVWSMLFKTGSHHHEHWK